MHILPLAQAAASAPALYQIGTVVVVILLLLAGVVNAERLRRNPPVEVDISTATEKVRTELTSKIRDETEGIAADLKAESVRLHARVTSQRHEFRQELRDLRTDIKADFGSMTKELHEGFRQQASQDEDRAKGIHDRINVLQKTTVSTGAKLDQHFKEAHRHG